MTSTSTDVPLGRERPKPGPPPEVAAAEPVLRALADPMRAAIVELLAGEQLCTCHLQEALGAKQTLVSHHLRWLRDAGVVLPEPCGRFTYYRLAPGAFDAARDALAGMATAAAATAPKRAC